MYTGMNQYRVVMEVAPRVLAASGHAGCDLRRQRFGSAGAALCRRHGSGAPPRRWSVNHQGQFPAITLSFNLLPGVSLGDAVIAIERAARDIGMPTTIHGGFQGTAQVFQESLANQPWLILAALVAVYIVLGILYESLVHPLTILSTLPSAGVGATLALLITGTDFTIIALIGLVLLIGIVKKNAIMMIDFALVAERSRQLPPEEAIRTAALLRFRPILMTTMAAMLGALPMALGTGTGSELRRPLGISIVGGLIVSQVLTLYTTPVVYLFMDRLRLRFARTASAASRQEQKRETRSWFHRSCVVALSACAPVGPKYEPPKTPAPAAYKEQPPGAELMQPAQPSDGGTASRLVGSLRRRAAERTRSEAARQQSDDRAGGSALPAGARAGAAEPRAALSDRRRRRLDRHRPRLVQAGRQHRRRGAVHHHAIQRDGRRGVGAGLLGTYSPDRQRERGECAGQRRRSRRHAPQPVRRTGAGLLPAPLARRRAGAAAADDRGLPEVVHADPEPVQRRHRRAGRRGAGGDTAGIGARAGSGHAPAAGAGRARDCDPHG